MSKILENYNIGVHILNVTHIIVFYGFCPEKFKYVTRIK